MIIDIIERFKANAAETWLVGDSLRDLQAIDAAGGKSALVLTGKGKKRWPNMSKNCPNTPKSSTTCSLSRNTSCVKTHKSKKPRKPSYKQQGRLKTADNGVQTAFKRLTFPRYADYPQPDLLVHPFLLHYFAVPIYAACPALSRRRAQNGANLGTHPQLVAQAHHRFELHLKRRGKHSRPPCHHLRQTPKRLGTLALQEIFPPQVYVAKRELFKIPFFGWGLKLVKTIGIDRSNSREANKQLLEQGLARKNEGYWITIFPEGTRLPPGEKGRYKLGGARMAKMFEMDIIPVALNSGEFWPRNSFLKYPGMVSVIIGKPIAHNNGNEAELMAQCEQWIESQQPLITGQGPFAPKTK